MGKIITISGTRCVGKTSVINSLRSLFPEWCIREDRPSNPASFNLDVEEEYCANERFYIDRQIEEYNKMRNGSQDSIIVRGPEDLLFYVLHYPVANSKSWDVKARLKYELELLDHCRSDKIIYLNASKTIVLERSRADMNKKRTTINHWVSIWHDSLIDFMSHYDTCDFVDTDDKTLDEVVKCVEKLIREV